MKKTLVLMLVALLGLVGVGIAREQLVLQRDVSKTEYFPNVGLRGANYVVATSSTTATAVGTNDLILFDVFVIKDVVARTGSVALTNTAGTALMTWDVAVSSVNANARELVGRVCESIMPSSITTPMRFTAGLKLTPSTTMFDVYALFLD